MKLRWLILLPCLGAACTLPKVDRFRGREAQEGSTGVVRASHAEPRSTASETMDALSLAAICIEKGDALGATEHLRRHIKLYPEQIMIRAYRAELLFQLGKWSDAQDEYDSFVVEAQATNGPAKQQILHCHTRLMEIALERNNSYAEHLHRGIGMVLLARKLGELREDPEPGFRERLLCKAAAELSRAAKKRPDEPRPHWYLAEVWTKLDQPRPAEKALKLCGIGRLCCRCRPPNSGAWR